MLQSKIAETPAIEQQKNSAIAQSKYIENPADNHSEWYQIEVGTERANVMKCPKNALF
ncbi:hypothetical protein PL11201_60028 [Planktothrix sp. PCC 11201]|uniref:hypothetical protein n=1 Tax=Planktothrix sp. PCC 11201 TaxID=1729650 RepID=UPI000922F353|nr:hypothetical protein [Planktothrix sp. PCC 11201]SKB14145.1 hypothetical protein PL11201_60028 [Planktothrix sp. PCC 11201]